MEAAGCRWWCSCVFRKEPSAFIGGLHKTHEVVALSDIRTPRSVIGVFGWVEVEATSKQEWEAREGGRVVESGSDYPADCERSACDDGERSNLEPHFGGLQVLCRRRAVGVLKALATRHISQV
jgi:hypothetical protein